MSEKDSENKRFAVIMGGLGLAAVGFVVAGLSSALGGNTNIEIIDNEDEF